MSKPVCKGSYFHVAPNFSSYACPVCGEIIPTHREIGGKDHRVIARHHEPIRKAETPTAMEGER